MSIKKVVDIVTDRRTEVKRMSKSDWEHFLKRNKLIKKTVTAVNHRVNSNSKTITKPERYRAANQDATSEFWC